MCVPRRHVSNPVVSREVQCNPRTHRPIIYRQPDPNEPNRTGGVISIKPSVPRASVIAAGGQGFYGDDFDPLFFENDQPITESLTWKRQREQQQEQEQHRRRVEDGASEENQEAFWKRKDR